MKIGHIVACSAVLAAASLWSAASAQDKTPPQPKAIPPAELKEKVSYAIGVNIGRNLKAGGYDVDLDGMVGAIKDVLAAKDLKFTDEQMREAMNAIQQELRARREEDRKRIVEKNQKVGEAFLAENKKKTGIKTQSVTMPDGTMAEFQYKVLTEGTGATPKLSETVSVNYRGTLIDGTEFDSSAKRGSGPMKFQVGGNIMKGWTEVLQLMKTGSKWQVFFPALLAYGERGFPPSIEPGAALIFDMEVVDVQPAPPPPPPAQPLTSDIIRVPSAEELKAGAKIEVLKPEDVEKQIRAATNKPAAPKNTP